MPKQNDDPKRLLPLARPRGLGLGVDTAGELNRLISDDADFPPIYKIHGKNFILACDRDAYRDRLIADALRDRGVGVRQQCTLRPSQ